jgi:hypothetical protein
MIILISALIIVLIPISNIWIFVLNPALLIIISKLEFVKNVMRLV